VLQGKQDKQTLLRQLPSVDNLLQQPQTQELLVDFGRPLTLEALRHMLEISREELLSGVIEQPPSAQQLIGDAGVHLVTMLAPTLYPVVNATGVIIHTNLGRAPLSQAALAAINNVAPTYSTLEYDPGAGERGSRTVHAEQYLKRITGAEAALVVNNNAAAVLLMLTALCRDQEVIISRGQLVEIGGGFRVPDVMAQSGAKLVEVGTTNRTHLRDYEKAISAETAAIMVAHPSNYRVIGFTSEPSLAELAELAEANSIPLLYDQGSGALLDVTPYGLQAEPVVQDELAAGADVIAFSGDKLLGGPQAGILCGREDLIDQLKQHPLARAIRADKLCLSALTATLSHYIKGEALREIPVWRMIARALQDINTEATTWATRLREHGIEATVIDGFSRVGGGSLPGTTLPTKLVAITNENAESVAARLRQASPPVIGRIQEDRLLLDPRTILPHQGDAMMRSLLEICT
jgi:L-seryl-tRNA(Ser) seleniumtransferase